MTDLAFRITLILILAAGISGNIRHRGRTSRAGRVDRSLEPFWILIPLRLAGAAMLLAAIAWLIRPEWTASLDLGLPGWARWLGVGIGALGSIALAVVLEHLGDNRTSTVGVRDRASLVTTGPYRYVRHPFYAAALLWWAAFVAITDNLVVLIAGAIGAALIAMRTPYEERELERRFGADYVAWAARTGAIVPRRRPRA